MTYYLNMVRQPLLTTGVGTSIQLDTTATTGFATMAGAGAVDQKTYSYIIVDGNNWEIHTQETYTAATRTFTRGTPDLSLISGTAGTTKIDIQAGAFVRIIASSKDLEYFFRMRGLRAVTGATDTILTDDSGGLVAFNRATAIAVTLPQAGTAGFETRWSSRFINVGVGDVTVTPTTSTIGGAASVVLRTGDSIEVISDGTNYYALTSSGSAASATTRGLVELATDTEAQGFADTVRALTASNLAALVPTQAIQEAASANDRFVTPGRQLFHHGSAKAWGEFGFTGGVPVALGTQYNVSSLADGGVGVPGINFSITFASANAWAPQGMKLLSTQVQYAMRINNQATTSITWVTIDDTNTGADIAVTWTAHGDLA